MSVRTMARVWEQSQHAGSELLMLLAIADFSDDDGRAYPAVLRATWARGSEKTEQEVINRAISLPLLVIDEVGASLGRDNEIAILFEAFDGRYREEKPTVIVSNLAMPDLSDCLGERIIDRLRENGKVIAFEGESQRGRTDRVL